MKNSDLLARSLRAVWHPCSQMKTYETTPPLAISRGSGVWLHDFEGNRYLDAISSWWVNLFGHANPVINAALIDQLSRIEHAMLAGFTHSTVVELSERLGRLSGLGHAFYGSDGASATEIALKMSFHYWRNAGRPRKTRFVSLENGYHGETLGALSVTDVALFKDVYAPLLRQGFQAPTPDWRKAEPGESALSVARRAGARLRDHLERHHEEVAALILEPLVQGAAGMAMYDAEYLRIARALCDEFSVHLIADEIAVGFGRTGSFFAFEQAGIRPDFLCLSKGITGGYLPLSAVLTTDAVYSAFYHEDATLGFLHSHSYTGNPLACRAALATLDIFEADDVLTRNRERAALLDRALDEVRQHPAVRNFRHLGMIWAFEVASEAPDIGRSMGRRALERGVLLRPIGNTVYLMPPYVLTEEEILFLANGVRDVVTYASRV